MGTKYVLHFDNEQLLLSINKAGAPEAAAFSISTPSDIFISLVEPPIVKSPFTFKS